MKHAYRITKYNPALRNKQGRYLPNEWTSFCDVGKRFDEGILELEAYERVEQAYIQTACDFLSASGVSEIQVVGLEDGGSNATIANGAALTLNEFASVLASVLREQFWCRFECPRGYVHVGYDFYMYVGVEALGPDPVARAKERGLFVEECVSPYHPEED